MTTPFLSPAGRPRKRTDAQLNQVLEEITGKSSVSPIDSVRRDYLRQLSEHTKRNVIAYYSGWLSQQQNAPTLSINDEDKNAFMATIHNLDRTKGLDLILHTPGGDLAAAESLVDYLRRMFGTDIRAIVPQLAMSAGTMIACSTKKSSWARNQT
jgi:ClpP class serine protease